MKPWLFQAPNFDDDFHVGCFGMMASAAPGKAMEAASPSPVTAPTTARVSRRPNGLTKERMGLPFSDSVFSCRGRGVMFGHIPEDPVCPRLRGHASSSAAGRVGRIGELHRFGVVHPVGNLRASQNAIRPKCLISRFDHSCPQAAFRAATVT